MGGFQRMTEQRRLILETLRSTTCHPTADWIYEKVRETLPHISLGTVYRNLRSLADRGEILQLHYGSGQDHFDGNPKPHYHFRCVECGRIEDVDLEYRPKLDQDAEKLGIGQIHKHRLEYVGLCRSCVTNAKGKDSKREAI